MLQKLHCVTFKALAGKIHASLVQDLAEDVGETRTAGLGFGQPWAVLEFGGFELAHA